MNKLPGDDLRGPYQVVLVVGETWKDGRPGRPDAFVSMVDCPDLAAVRQFLDHAATSASLFGWANKGESKRAR